MTKFDVVSWCIGYYKMLDETTYECIRKLYANDLIDN